MALTVSSILTLFNDIASLQNDWLVMSKRMQFTFGGKREVYLMGESALSVTKKERRREGKRSIGPRMKYVHAIGIGLKS